MRKRRLKPDAVIAVALSFVGGLLDVYCLFNFNVYATLHTGNIIKLMTHLLDGNFTAFLDTLFVLVAFAVGIYLTNIYENRRNTAFQTIIVKQRKVFLWLLHGKSTRP